MRLSQPLSFCAQPSASSHRGQFLDSATLHLREDALNGAVIFDDEDPFHANHSL
jgi:hypothetical protein